MSTSLVKKHDQKNLVPQQHQRKSKVVSGTTTTTNEDDEADKFIQLFPKCKPRLSSSPSEKSSTSRGRKSMDCNANSSSTGSISPPKQFNKNNVNSFTRELNKTSVPKTYPGSVRQIKSENYSNNKHKGQREKIMDVSSTNMPDSFGRLYAAGDSPKCEEMDVDNGSANTTPTSIQNSMFLRDSRIEIAGGRELYSHSRNKTGRRIKEQHQLRTVPGPQQQREIGEPSEMSKHDESTQKQKNTHESITSHANQSLIRECQAYNPMHRGHLEEARSRHSFSGYGYSPFSPASSETKSDLATTTKPARPGGAIARRSRTSVEFPSTSFPNTHPAPLTLKETVFGSEITSIEKSVSGTATDKTSVTPRVVSVDDESDKPYIYETPLGTTCGEGEIVFDDIDEYELDERHYSTETLQSHPVITKDSYGQETEKSKRGDDDNTSPSGYESDECSLPSSKVKSSSPNGNKRLIGTVPIADYERSPKRYGLNSRQMESSYSDQAIRKQRVPSPSNLYPKMPGFPQRVTHLDVDPSLPNTSAIAIELESRLPQSLPVTATSPSSVDHNRKEVAAEHMSPMTMKSNEENQLKNALSSQSGAHCSDNNPVSFNQALEDASSSCPNRPISISQISDPYMYEFSETKKVLEEFFKGGGAVGASYSTTTSNEIDYVLRRQAGNSYVGQRLAGDLSLVEESPKLPPRRGGREVVMSLDLNPKNPCAGNGSALRLITFHEVSRSPEPGSQQGDANRDVNDNDIETGSTNTETDLGDTEIGLQVGRTRNFTLSPETTDCDSNELESEMSLDYEASVHSSTKVGGTMPILEDGLSSGNVSEAEEENIARMKAMGPNSLTTTPKMASMSSTNISATQSFDGSLNPTVMLMKKQISEIEKEIRLRATQQHHHQNGIPEPSDMSSMPHLPVPGETMPSPSSGQLQVRVSEPEGSPGRFDSNDPELEALDPMRRTPPPSPAPGSTVVSDSISKILKSSTHPSAAIGELPEYSGANPNTVNAALKDIKEAIQRTKHLHQNSHQVPQIDSSHAETTAFSSSQDARDRISSPVWVPRKSSAAGLHRHERLGSREVPTSDARLREPLLRKPKYEETGVEDVSDADTDQETDRLLGQNRTDDDYGFYDEKEKDGVKKKRSKEDLLKTPAVLIEGVLFRARYLGSTQLDCEGQPTKATRMIQAEEAVSRIKPQEEVTATENGEKTEPQPLRNSQPSHDGGCNGVGGGTEISSNGLAPNSNHKQREEPCIGCEYEDYLYALGGDESEDDSYEEYYGRKSHVNRLGLKFIDNNKKLDPRYTSLPLQDPFNSSTSSSSSSNATARAQRAGSVGNISLTKVTSPVGSSSSPSSINKPKSLQHQIPIPFHLSPPCGSALPGTMFRLRFVGSLEVEEETGIGKKRRKRPKKIMVEEAVTKLKSMAPEGETQPSTEVDLFISTEKIMVLNTDLKEIMMDHALRTISYIADIGDLVVLMARRRPIPTDTPDDANKLPRPPKMICHVFESDEAQYIAQSIGQAFQVAYMEFLKANGIEDHSFVREMDYQEVLNSQEIFGDELQMFAKKELQKDVVVPKTKGEILGVVIVESGWGSMLPTVVIANLAPGNPAARCGQLNIGDQIIAINGISLVGLPLSTCQNYIKKSKEQNVVKLTVVPCPPVVEVKIKRPDTKYQLGFSVQNGVICSLLRGGIAERGGVRVGHRIIEINNQSVVAVPHEKIVNLLATSVGEINLKTMPTSMFRLLTGQETPLYI